MTQETLNKTYYILENDVITPIVYSEYLREYGADETTTPKGVAPRLHVRENETVDGMQFEVWTWGVGGNNPRREDAFGTEEEARMYIWDSWEANIQYRNDNAPGYFCTIEELKESYGI